MTREFALNVTMSQFQLNVWTTEESLADPALQGPLVPAQGVELSAVVDGQHVAGVALVGQLPVRVFIVPGNKVGFVALNQI